ILTGLTRAQALRDNFGKEFFLAFGKNLGGNDDSNRMELYITSKVPAQGYVEVPALAFKQSFTSTPGMVTTIELPSDNFGGTVELQRSEFLEHGLAVHVVADSEIAVFGMN